MEDICRTARDKLATLENNPPGGTFGQISTDRLTISLLRLFVDLDGRLRALEVDPDRITITGAEL